MHLDKENFLITWLLDSGVQESQVDHPAYGGVHAGYDTHKDFWLFYYSEITGYSISMLCMLYQINYEEKYLDIARGNAEFLLKYQISQDKKYIGGAFPEGMEADDLCLREKFYSFDAAMCIQGLLDLYSIEKNEALLSSAINAGNWLISMQTTSGSFLSCIDSKTGENQHLGKNFWEDFGCLHAKHAIALLKLYKVTGVDKYKISALKVCDWVLSLQDDDGSFWVNSTKSYVYSHAHCYAIEGLMYAYEISGNSSYAIAINKACDWIKGKINWKYGGILGSHKISGDFIAPEAHTSKNYLQVLRKFFPRKEIATDATFQVARIFLYRYFRGEDLDGLKITNSLIKTLYPNVINNDIGGVHARLEISLSPFLVRKMPIISTWGVLFALQATILLGQASNENKVLTNIDYLF